MRMTFTARLIAIFLAIAVCHVQMTGRAQQPAKTVPQKKKPPTLLVPRASTRPHTEVSPSGGLLPPQRKTPSLSGLKNTPKTELGARKKRVENDKAQVLARLKANDGAPLVAVVLRMFEEFSRGKRPTNDIETIVHGRFRRAKPQVMASILKRWNELGEKNQSALAGTALARRVAEPRRGFTMDSDVTKILKQRYLARSKDLNDLPRRPIRPSDFGGVRLSPSFEKYSEALAADLLSLMSGCQLSGMIQDIPTHPRGIKQVLIREVRCVDETDAELFSDDNVFVTYLIEHADATGNVVIEGKTTSVVKGLADGDERPFADTDIVVFQAPVGFEPSVVTVGAILWESDVDQFTLADGINILVHAGIDVLKGLAEAEGIPTFNLDTALKDISDGIVSNIPEIDVIGRDTMWIRATGIEGASFLSTGPSTAIERGKKRLHFKGLGGEYQLTHIRAITNPNGGGDGRIDAD